MGLFSWLPWHKRAAAETNPRPMANAHAARSVSGAVSRAGVLSSHGPLSQDTYAPDDDGSGATKFMSSRAMVEVLIDEILRNATIPKEERSIRLYSLSAVGEELQDAEGERFILLVKLKRARSEMWENFPALGVYLIKEIKSRLGVEVGQVYWSLSRSTPLAKKLPQEWVMGSRISRVVAANVAAAKNLS